MKSFHHINASSMGDVVNTLNNYEGKAEILAGGTDILGVLKDQVLPHYPEVLINIKTIPGLDYIREDSGGLKIGPLVKLADLIKSPLIQETYQALAEACKAVGTPQIRNMATLGGNLAQDTRCWYYRYPHSIGGRILCLRKGSGPCLAVTGDNRYHAIFGGKRCFAVCPSDIAVALILLDAGVKTVGAGGGRIISLQDFYNPLGNVLESNEMISEIQVPRAPERGEQRFQKYSLRKPDFALVSVAALVVMDGDLCREARIALGAVAPAPLRSTQAEQSLLGNRLNKTTLEKAAHLAVQGAKPLSMNNYKIEITRSLVASTIADCL